MTLLASVLTRNAMLNAIETYGGEAPVLKIRTGAPPATCETADSGDVLATLTLPTDWMAAADSASKAMAGTWADSSADGTGTAAHYRLYKADGSTVVMQGTVTATGDGGDMTVDNVSFAAGQAFSISGFTLTLS